MHSCTASFDEMEPMRMTAFKAIAPNAKEKKMFKQKSQLLLLNKTYGKSIL